MTNTTDALRLLHRIHKQLTDLRGRLEHGPKQVAAAEASVRKLEAAAEQVKESHKKARVLADDKQLQLKSREARLADLRAKLNAASSNKEYQMLKEQIAADQQANLVLQDEILELLERLDVLAEQLKGAQAQLAKAKEEGAKTKARVEGERTGLESELARVQAELHQAETLLPAEFKTDYDRVARVRGEGALAEVDGQVCSGCYQMLTTNMISDLRLSKPVFCKSCGALLYLPENGSGNG